MEIIINAALIRNLDDVELFNISVNEKNFIKVRKKLEFEKFKIICLFKQMKDNGEIKSIWRPKNKKIQKQLNSLVKTKNIINSSIDKVREAFYK